MRGKPLCVNVCVCLHDVCERDFALSNDDIIESGHHWTWIWCIVSPVDTQMKARMAWSENRD